VKPPPPEKLAAHIAVSGGLASLPNVQVSSRRITPIDKDKMVGRWKVIVKELRDRGLPVTGTGRFSKSVESLWMQPREMSRILKHKTAVRNGEKRR